MWGRHTHTQLKSAIELAACRRVVLAGWRERETVIFISEARIKLSPLECVTRTTSVLVSGETVNRQEY